MVETREVQVSITDYEWEELRRREYDGDKVAITRHKEYLLRRYGIKMKKGDVAVFFRKFDSVTKP